MPMTGISRLHSATLLAANAAGRSLPVLSAGAAPIAGPIGALEA